MWTQFDWDKSFVISKKNWKKKTKIEWKIYSSTRKLVFIFRNTNTNSKYIILEVYSLRMKV